MKADKILLELGFKKSPKAKSKAEYYDNTHDYCRHRKDGFMNYIDTVIFYPDEKSFAAKSWSNETGQVELKIDYELNESIQLKLKELADEADADGN